MDLIVILLVLLLLFGGIGGGGYYATHYGVGGGIGIFGLVVIICLLVYLVNRSRP
jgi:hypothetical protein